MSKTLISVFLVLLLLSACSAPAKVVNPSLVSIPTVGTVQAQPEQTEAATQPPTLTPEPTLRPTLTPSPTLTATPTPVTPTPTPTRDPSIYKYDDLSDPRNLDSFVFTSNISKVSKGGGTETSKTTYEFVKESDAIHMIYTYKGPSFSSESDTYVIGDWVYNKNDKAYTAWSTSSALGDPRKSMDIRSQGDGGLGYFTSGTFVGIEDYDGTPAYHYSFGKSDLVDNMGDLKIDDAQADLYVMVDGYYPIRFTATFSGNLIYSPNAGGFVPGVWKVDKRITSINQLPPITLPDDYPDFNLEPGVPLPPEVQLQGVAYFRSGEIQYEYKTTTNPDAFIEFYQNMPPTNGWSVVEVGSLEYCPICAILTDGSQEAIVQLQVRIEEYRIQLNFPSK